MIIDTGKTFKGGWEVLTVFLAMFHLTTEKKRVLVQSIYVKQCSLLSLHLLSTLVTDLDYVLSQFEDFFATKMTKSIITFAFWTNQLKFLWQIQWTSMQNFQLWLDFISSHRIYKIGLLFTLRESHARNDIRDLTPKDTNFKWRAKKQNNNKKYFFFLFFRTYCRLPARINKTVCSDPKQSWAPLLFSI